MGVGSWWSYRRSQPIRSHPEIFHGDFIKNIQATQSKHNTQYVHNKMTSLYFYAFMFLFYFEAAEFMNKIFLRLYVILVIISLLSIRRRNGLVGSDI